LTAAHTAFLAYKLSSRDNAPELGGIGAGIDLTANTTARAKYAALAWNNYVASHRGLGVEMIMDDSVLVPWWGPSSSDEIYYFSPSPMPPSSLSMGWQRFVEQFVCRRKRMGPQLQDYLSLAVGRHSSLLVPQRDFIASTLPYLFWLILTAAILSLAVAILPSAFVVLRHGGQTVEHISGMVSDMTSMGRSATSSLDYTARGLLSALPQAVSQIKLRAWQTASVCSDLLWSLGSGIYSLPWSGYRASLVDFGSDIMTVVHTHGQMLVGWVGTQASNFVLSLKQWNELYTDDILQKISDAYHVSLNESVRFAIAQADHIKSLPQEISSHVQIWSSALLDHSSLLLQKFSNMTGMATYLDIQASFSHLERLLDASAIGLQSCLDFAKRVTADAIRGVQTMSVPTMAEVLSAGDNMARSVVQAAGITYGTIVGTVRGMLELASGPASTAYERILRSLPTSEKLVHNVASVMEFAGIAVNRTVPALFRSIRTLKTTAANLMELSATTLYASSQDTIATMVSTARDSLCGTLCKLDPSEARLALESGLCVKSPGISAECPVLHLPTQSQTRPFTTLLGWL